MTAVCVMDIISVSKAALSSSEIAEALKNSCEL